MTEMQLTRRDLLTFAAGALAPLSGCGEPAGRATLSIRQVSAARSGGRWRLELALENVSSNLTRSEETFHEVVLLVYGPSGEQLISRELGTVSGAYDQSVDIETERFPAILTFDARDGVCPEVRDIAVVCFAGRQDRQGRLVWEEIGTRTCDEGLPPDCDTLATPPSKSENSPTDKSTARTSE